MTTIVFKHPHLVADRQITLDGHFRILCENKIEVLPNGWIFAGGGDVDDIAKAKKYFLKTKEEKPTKEERVKGAFCCIVIKGSKVYYAEGNLTLLPLETPFYAIGSGYKFAYQSLHMGKDAVASLLDAAKLDIFTSPEYTIYTIEENAQPKKKKALKPKNSK
jgi:hypothetical protein